MNGDNRRKLVTILFNPFVYVAGGKALAYGLGCIVLAALIGWASRTHFDGVLDMHSGRAAPVWIFLVEGLVNWLSLGLVLLLAGRIISRTSFRTIDVFGTQALARWPTLLTALLALVPAFQRFSEHLARQLTTPGAKLEFGGDAVVFFMVVTAMFPLLCWMVALMYRAFSISCNVKGARAVITFVISLLVAEIVSKLVLVKWVLVYLEGV